MKTYYTDENTTHYINYHFVFCPRYRRKIFKDERILSSFEGLLGEIGKQLDLYELVSFIGEDYVHLQVKAPPHLSPHSIVAKIKNVTSKKLREEFPQYQNLVSLWTRSYLVSTDETLDESFINSFIELQKKRG